MRAVGLGCTFDVKQGPVHLRNIKGPVLLRGTRDPAVIVLPQISCLTFMVPRPHVLGSSADAVIQPLQHPVWAGWLLSILVATVASRLLDYVARRVGVVTAKGKVGQLEFEIMKYLVDET